MESGGGTSQIMPGSPAATTAQDKPKTSLKLPENGTKNPQGSYRGKLPSLSPRSMKLFTDGLASRIGNDEGLTVEYGQQLAAYDETLSNSSSSATSTDSGCPNTTAAVNTEPAAVNSVAESSKSDDTASQASHEDDIEFFVQVVGVFRQYVTDQINVLDTKLQQGQDNFKEFQKMIKSNEERCREDEAQLTADVSRLTALLFQRQSVLKSNLQSHHHGVMMETREGMDACRKTLKSVSGTLAFAKNLREHSGENFREKAVKELKTRLKEISGLETKTLSAATDSQSQRLELERLQDSITNLDFHKAKTLSNVGHEISSRILPVIEAPRFRSDITKDSILVRWNCDVITSTPFTVQWSFMSALDDVITRSLEVEGSERTCTICDLPSNRDVTVRVTCSESGSESAPALYTTRPGPRQFSFDMCTAHAKLRLSNDGKTVSYGGDHQPKGASPQSSIRFTFALNVLGDIAFYAGRHYFEMKVNADGWAVGVAYQTIARNSWLGSNDSSWILHFNGAKYQYKVRHAGESADVKPGALQKETHLDKIGVYVNYEPGVLSFVDPDMKEVLHTSVVKGGFTDALCAAVNPFYHGGKLTLITGLEVPTYVIETK